MHRRRREHRDVGVLDGGELLVQRAGDLRLREMPSRSSKSLSGKNTSAALDCAAKPLAETPRELHRVEHARLLLGDLAHATHHFVGALERGGRRQLHHADQVQLVLLRDEARRRALKPNTVSATRPA